MANVRVASSSTEYVQVVVDAEDSQGDPVNPTAIPVHLAFVDHDDPAPAADDPRWRSGSWAQRPAGGQPQYMARALVGPGSPGGALQAGEYRVFVKIEATPELPIKPSPDMLTVIA
jgi:hypothetical protein